MTPRRPTRDLPADWPGWSDTRPVDEADTLPDSHKPAWTICWIRIHAQWQGAIITAWRRTTDGDWAAFAAWGLGEAEHGWIRHDRTVKPAEPPKS